MAGVQPRRMASPARSLSNAYIDRPRGLSIAERLARRSVQVGSCLVWTGHCDDDGYGQIEIKGRTLKVHRVAWELAHGPLPPGKQVLHRCDNPPCIADDHHFLGDHDVNMADKAAKGRAPSHG